MLIRLRQLLYRVEATAAAGCLLLMLLLSLGQIVARNLFDTGFVYADLLTRNLVLYVALLGAVLAVDRGRHITIDVVSTWWPQLTEALYRPIHLLCAAVCGLLMWAGKDFWWQEWQYASDFDRWHIGLAVIIPVGFGLLALHFLFAALIGREPR